MKKNPVIDFHTYLGKDAYSDYHQTAEELVRAMDQNAIDLAVIAPLQDYPGPDALSHEIVNQARSAYPDRFILFARLDPRYGNQSLEELARLVEDLGFRGLLFNPLSTQTPAHHPALLPLMEAAASYKIPVLVPAGNGYFGLPEQVAVLANKVPNLKIVLGHMGSAPHATRAIDLAGKTPNLYLETSLQQSTFRIPLAVNTCSAGKLIFGSASPYGHVYPEKEKILNAAIKPEERELIMGLNAKELLGFI